MIKPITRRRIRRVSYVSFVLFCFVALVLDVSSFWFRASISYEQSWVDVDYAFAGSGADAKLHGGMLTCSYGRTQPRTDSEIHRMETEKPYKDYHWFCDRGDFSSSSEKPAMTWRSDKSDLASTVHIEAAVPLHSVVFGAAAVALLLKPRRKLVPRGTCSSCGYNLTANTSGVCPECGTAVPQKPEAIA